MSAKRTTNQIDFNPRAYVRHDFFHSWSLTFRPFQSTCLREARRAELDVLG